MIDQSELHAKYELLPGTVLYTAIFGTDDDVQFYSQSHPNEVCLHVTNIESVLGKSIIKAVVLRTCGHRLLLAVVRRMRSLLGRHYKPVEVRSDYFITDEGQTYYDGWFESNGIKIVKDICDE